MSGAGRAVLGVALGGALIAGLLIGRAPRGPVLVSGRLEADEVRLGSRLGGRVREVLVQEGQAVVASQSLVRLDPYDLEDRIAEAEARRLAAQARLARLEAGSRPEEIAQAVARRNETAARLAELRAGPRKQELAASRAGLELAEAERRLAELERARVADLAQSGTATREQLDTAQTAVAVARARVQTRQAELELLQEGTRAEALAQAEARLAQADAALELARAGAQRDEVAQARWELQAAGAAVEALSRGREELLVVASTAGVVDALSLQPGDLVAPSAPVLTLRDTARLFVRVYVPAPYLRRVQEGGALEVQIDGYPGRTFRGVVRFVSVQAEFTPSNVQSPEERQQQVFRVRLELEHDEPTLRPGMSADVVVAPAP